MRLTRKQTICDIPILKIRDYFDHIRPALISPEMISEQFDLNKEKTKELIDALLSEGYIEAAKKKGKYQLTIKGQALCVARYTNPLNKEKADKLFKEFMERVEEINSNEFYLYRVSKIVLFGSYIDPEKTDYAILFMNRDDRFYTSVAYNGSEYKIKELNPGEFLWTGRDANGQSIEFPIHNPGESFDPINTGFICKKSIDPDIDKSTVHDADVDWVEIRFAEVLMNYGECANELGKTDEALDVLYQIRKRANIEAGADNRYGLKETTQDAIRERYIKERFVEFLFESKRLDDLRRWRRFDIINSQKKQYGIQSWLKPGYDIPKITDDIYEIWDHFEPHIVEVSPEYTYNMKDQYYFYAIPRKHLDANPKLKQNNNWDGGTFDPLL